MNCKQIDKNLIFYIEGSIKESEKTIIQNHIESCPECAAKLNYLKSSLAQLELIKDSVPKPFMFTRIQGRLSKAPSVNRNRVFVPVAWAAILVVGLLMGSLIGNTIIPFETQSNYEVAYLFNDSGLENVESYLMGD